MIALLALTLSLDADAFCGFYVAKADSDLYNEASQVVLARNGERTVVTMANDYQGDPSEFAMVVPVPTVIEQGDVKVVDAAVIEAVDAFSAPRLVEYWDDDPCAPPEEVMKTIADFGGRGLRPRMQHSEQPERERYGVEIEAEYSVEEYDVLILSAQESGGLQRWLLEEGYRVPRGASEVLGSYIRQEMRFFVAKVDLEEHDARGAQMLRPLQVHYDSHKFMLPIRLGTVNARGSQDLLVYTLTPHGRVEATNYRTVRLPTDLEVPELVQHEFGAFYTSMFDKLVEEHDMRAVVTEYAWPLSIMCDPCSADPLTMNQLQALGASWVQPSGGKLFDAAYLTRLHVRYDRERFPEDLRFQETRDTGRFQGRYVVRHAFRGRAQCKAARRYYAEVAERRAVEVANLARLTGWDPVTIASKMAPLPDGRGTGSGPLPPAPEGPWGPSFLP